MQKFILSFGFLIIILTYILSKTHKSDNISINNINQITTPLQNELKLEYYPTNKPTLFDEGKYTNQLNKIIKTKLTFNLLDDYDLFNSNIVFRIAFGSCNYQHNSQNFWNKINNFNPQLWIFLGDNVYADKTDKWDKLLQKPSIDNMIEQYEKLAYSTPFRKFMKNKKIKKIGIWDDHNYLINDAGASENEHYKSMSKKLFTLFLNIKKNNPLMKREGIYSYYDLVIQNEHIARFFLLDVRTFRSEVDILGNDQWNWLEKNLADSSAKVNILCSGSTVLTKISDWDSWFKNGWAYHRLINTLKLLNMNNVIILSGDIHQGRLISKNNLIEIVSSSLSSPIEKYDKDTEYNIGKIVQVHNFGFIDIINESNKYYLVGGLVDFNGNLYNLIKILI